MNQNIPTNLHNLEPDFERPVFQLTEERKKSIFEKLSSLYGDSKARQNMPELERVMAVYYAHKLPKMIEWEKTIKPEDRFNEQDVILITYGDLIKDTSEKPLHTLSEICNEKLQGVFNSIHLLPFFPYSSDRGFAVRDFREVDPALGTWDDIYEIGQHFKLMFDGVFNHISSKSFWFQEFLNGNPEYFDFFTAYSDKKKIPKKHLKMLLRPRTSSVLTPFNTYKGKKLVWTTFSADQIDLNFQNPKVLLKMIEILLIYIRRGADIIRLDAVTYLWDELGTTGAHLSQTHIIIKLMREILDAVAPHVAIITETNVPHQDNISYFGNGSDEAQMVYNFALPPLILHTFQTGNSEKLSSWAKSLQNPSQYATFFNFLDSHDGIGVMGARGILSDEEITAMAERVREHGGLVSYKSDGDGKESIYELNITSYSALNKENCGEEVDFQVQRYLAARSIPLVLIGVPGIYLHGLLGSKNDIEGVMTDNEKRSINRNVINKQELIRSLDNTSTTTHKVSYNLGRMVIKRTQEKAFHPHAYQKILNCGTGLFAVLRSSLDNKEHILAVTNVTGNSQTCGIDLESLGLSYNRWYNILQKNSLATDNTVLQLELSPYEICWLKGMHD